MPIESRDRGRASEGVERFVKQLLVAHKAVKLYPPSSAIPRESARGLLGQLAGLLRENPELRLQVTKEALLHNALPVMPGSSAFGLFTKEFYSRNLSEVRFHAGASEKEIIDFLRVLIEPPEEIAVAGGFEQRLWDLQVDGVTVTEISAKVIDAPEEDQDSAEGGDGEPWPPPRSRVDELIETAYGAHPRDQRVLVRFAQTPRLVARYLAETASDGATGRALVNLLASRIAALAHVANDQLADEQSAMFRSIAEGLMSLSPDLRRQVLTERLLGDSRMDAAITGVLRQLELGELCFALAEGLTPDPVSHDGIARAIRNLATISLLSRAEVVATARDALERAGVETPTIESVLEGVAPTQLRVKPLASDREEGLESALRLLDLAPAAEESADPELAALQQEARDGITDGQVAMSLIDLVMLERRPDIFAALMAILGDSLGMLLEWGEHEVASAAARGLKTILDSGELDREQTQLVRDALRRLAGPDQMRQLSATMRVHRPGSLEYEACRELLGTLGGESIEPLLEALADEPDMAARKALVELVSELASDNVETLGSHLLDGRWFFVRNVVAILGATHSAEAVTHLARTVRHSDARVRRETIRALAGIRDRMAEEMLVAALADEDSQNVQLAARYLGSLGSRGSVTALMMVARGEGRGNREIAPRVEAIEALGRIGAAEAVPTLEDLARQRGIIRGRTREVRAAAEAVLAAMRRGAQGGGGR